MRTNSYDTCSVADGGRDTILTVKVAGEISFRKVTEIGPCRAIINRVFFSSEIKYSY